jgi:dTDP-4-amino-4,6-dideoxygalactose transaminase
MSITPATNRIEKMSGTEFNLLTNRAASAIHLALTTFSRTGIILIPSNICLSPIMASKIANYEVRFIGTDKFQIDLMDVVKHLESDTNVNAILLPELYGYPILNLEIFWECIKERNILVLEDLAQSLGKSRMSQFSGKPTVVTIYSFGLTKIIDTIRCGVISTANESFFQDLKARYSSLEKNSQTEFEAASGAYNKLYKELLTKDEVNRDWPEFYTAASKLSTVLYTPRFPKGDIGGGFNFEESTIIQSRNERHARFLELLKGYESIILPPEVELTHPVWRTTIRLDCNVRNSVVDRLRNMGYPVSTWYKAMHRMFQGDDLTTTDSLNEAVRFENEVVNLFLDLPNFDEYFGKVRCVIIESLG